MIRRLKAFEGQMVDPYSNLALEQLFLYTLGEEECILYLWQNENTVVIGRNQNAWKECHIEKMKEDGVRLARRVSGGGAVYHDLGNLNFTFLIPTEEFNSRQQAEIIVKACAMAGISAEISGRNDLTADGKKFSGSAFYHHRGRSFHHGTLLVNSDLDAMGRYLRPSAEKMKAKGVDSVEARVGNLSSVNPQISVRELKDRIIEAFSGYYGLCVNKIEFNELDKEQYEILYKRSSSYEWNYGQKLRFQYSFERRFAWGDIRAEFCLDGGIISRCMVWTDAMDPFLKDSLQQALQGCRFDVSEMCEKVLQMNRPESPDICRLFREENL